MLFGTQTGNAGYLAEQLVGALHAAGLGANATELDAAGVERLLDSSHVVVISSTYGEGEMPDNAELFWEALVDSGTPRLEHLKYSVLALGDSGYDHFCQAGKDIDLRLEQLGARRLAVSAARCRRSGSRLARCTARPLRRSGVASDGLRSLSAGRLIRVKDRVRGAGDTLPVVPHRHSSEANPTP